MRTTLKRWNRAGRRASMATAIPPRRRSSARWGATSRPSRRGGRSSGSIFRGLRLARARGSRDRRRRRRWGLSLRPRDPQGRRPRTPGLIKKTETNGDLQTVPPAGAAGDRARRRLRRPRRDRGTNPYAGSNSDTLMLLRADPTNNTLSLLSFPRDLCVHIYCNGQHGPDAGPDQRGVGGLRQQRPGRGRSTRSST